MSLLSTVPSFSSEQESIKTIPQASIKSAAKKIIYKGFDRMKLPESWDNALNYFLAPGQGAEQVRIIELFNVYCSHETGVAFERFIMN